MDDISWCIDYLKKANGIEAEWELPSRDVLRALMNMTMPIGLPDEFYERQDRAIREIVEGSPVVEIDDLKEVKDRTALYKGDITRIKADAIVNAGNERLLGCFRPLHGCVDNAIHSFAGLEVRRDLLKIMARQGHVEPNGRVKVTKGYNLPSRYIFHTVGPKSFGRVDRKGVEDLKNCYLSCLRKADEMNLKSIVFPSISTGIYAFPKNKASEIAIGTVKEYLKDSGLNMVVFDVFCEEDYEIYRRTIERIYR